MRHQVARRRTGRGGPARTLWMLALAVALLMPAAIAWACNPQAELSFPDGTTYAPGEEVTVKGSLFPVNKEVTVRPPGGRTARVMTNDRGVFLHRFDAPREPDAYVVNAQAVGDDGRTYLKTSDVFTVRERRSESPSPGAPSQPGQPGGTPPAQRPGRPGTPDASPRTGGSDGTAVSPGTGASGQAGGRDVFAGSVPRSSSQGAIAPGAATARDRSAGGRSAATPSERAAFGDLWSGLGQDKVPSLFPGPTDPPVPDGGPGSQLGWGIALLGLGLVALLTGLTVAELRRRRARAG